MLLTFDVTIRVDQNVAGLQISVDHIGSVHVPEPVEDLEDCCNGECALRDEAAVANQLQSSAPLAMESITTDVHTAAHSPIQRRWDSSY